MEAKEYFAERLVKLREDRNITQQALADDLGITRQSLSLYEKADRTINIDLLVKIADYFNVSADYLLGIQGEQTKNKDVVFICEYTGLSEHVVKQLNLNTIQPRGIDFNKTLNRLIELGYMGELTSELCKLQKNSSRYMKSKNGDPVYTRGNMSNKCDIIRYRLLMLIVLLSDQFDHRKWVNENGEYNPPKE